MNAETRKQFSLARDLLKEYFPDDKHPVHEHSWTVVQKVNDIHEREVPSQERHSLKPSTLDVFYDKAEIVALIHDLVEDSECTLDILKERGLDAECLDAVDAITRRKDEQYYFDYIERVSKNSIARLVKICDLEHNMDIRRLEKFGEYEQKRLAKYWHAWRFLQGKENAVTANNMMHPDRLFR